MRLFFCDFQTPCNWYRNIWKKNACANRNLDFSFHGRMIRRAAKKRINHLAIHIPFSGPQGRSLGFGFTTTTTTKPSINKYIKYNFATNKKKVSIPKYHYDGGPEMTSTILGLCWRLHYVRCPNVLSQNSRMKDRFLQKIHPCCHLLSKPSGFSPLESRLSKWLRHQMVWFIDIAGILISYL